VPGELCVDPSQLESAAAGLRQTASDLTASVQAFQAQVQGLVEAPGTDPISPLIWAAHGAVFSAAMRCFASNAAAMTAHAAKLDRAAANYRRAEQDNVAAVRQIHGLTG
jgi:excreted virulence factor EspC (type VII ESX diderm)